MLKAASGDAKAAGLIDFWVTSNTWLETGLKIAADAPAIILDFFKAIGTVEEAQKTIVWLAAAAVIVNVYLGNQLGQSNPLNAGTIAKINIPGTGLGSPEPEKRCTGKEPLTIESVSCSEFKLS